jgi:signal transduction histidine kinase
MPSRWSLSIRVRLTLLYAGAFFIAGMVLVALMYLYLGQVLSQQMALRFSPLEQAAEQVPADPGAQAALRFLASEAPDVLAAEVRDLVGVQLQRARSNTQNTMLVASLILLGVVGITAAGFGWLLAGEALHPLRQITATARRVADRSLHERIALAGPKDEVKDLADTLDEMLERLDRSFDSQRRFVGNASHELRTPLTINRTLIEVALEDPQVSEAMRQLGTTLLAVNQRHERLIDGLLTLARSEQRVTEPVLVDLAEIARHVIAEVQGAAHDAGVDIRTDLQPALAAGDPILLERLIQNLVDNAIRYNLPRHGLVSVATSAVDGDAILLVENTGPVVPPYELPILFEPFRRLRTTERLADTSGSAIGRSAGLGLSIVRSVARAHGGEAHATPREDGGLILHVRIPAATEKIAAA